MGNPSAASGSPPPLPPLATPVIPVSVSNFSYVAQTEEGMRFSGDVEAPDGPRAIEMLERMRLRVIEIVASSPPPRQPSRDSGLLAFNQQLAKLTMEGVPIEQGLRLAAADMPRGRLRHSVLAISDEVQGGVAPAEAFALRRRQFPGIYAKLIDAGVQSNSLPGVLLNLGRQMELEQRLRSVLWRSIVHPLITLIALVLLAGFMGAGVMPRLAPLLNDKRLGLPFPTQAVLWFGQVAPSLLLWTTVAAIATTCAWFVIKMLGGGGQFRDALLLPVPIAGPVLRFSLIARWLNVLRVSLLAGIELPTALAMAGSATASAPLRRDSEQLASALAAGTPISMAPTRILPATVPMALEVAMSRNDLPANLETLCELYERQAELRLERIPALLVPLLVILIAIVVGFVLCGVLMPMLTLIQDLSGLK